MIRLMKSLREYRVPSLKSPFFVIIESILEIMIPTLMAFLIDRGIEAGNMNQVYFYGLLLVLASAFSLWTGVLAGKYAAIAGAGFAKNLRKDQFEQVQKFSFANIDKFSTSSLITRMTTDITNVQQAFQMMVRLGVRAPVMILTALFFAFRIDASLGLIFLAVIPILAIGLWIVQMKVHPVFVRVFDTYDGLNNQVQENLHGIRAVKSFAREPYEEKRFGVISRRIYKDFVWAEQRLAYNMPLMQLCLYSAMLMLSWFGAQEIVASGNNATIGLSTGELTSLITYAMQILMSLMMLSMVYVMIVISQASVDRIQAVLDEKSTLQNPAQPLTEMRDGSVVFDHVVFKYGSSERPVLNDINLNIPSGSTIGILGGTGAAKSTLVQLIARLYDVTQGAVLVGGEDVRNYDLDVLRNQVAMVLQKNILFSGTIKDNLRWGDPQADDDAIRHVCEIAQADGFIREFPDGYDTWIEQGGTNVSGGQRQRLCIARALLRKPKILIMDDSTSAIDTKTDQSLREALRTELQDMTKIIIAQRIASIMDSDKIVVMDDGQVIDFGTHNELMQRCQIYQEVYTSQMQGGILNDD